MYYGVYEPCIYINLDIMDFIKYILIELINKYGIRLKERTLNGDEARIKKEKEM